MVDAVIAWVDGSDVKLQAKRQEFLRQTDKHTLRNGAFVASRWTDNHELAYCVRLIRANAPWIGTIFLVTDKQVPPWLTPECATRLRIEVIDHTVIFAATPQCLPTFNSSSIEYALHNIPGLSERFLYFNDDMFIIRPLKEDDMFGAGTVRPRGAITWKNRTAASVATFLTGNVHARAGVIRYRGGARNSLSPSRVFRRAHAPYPLLRSRLQALFPPARIAAMAHYRFRAKEQLNPLDTFFNRMMRAGVAVAGPRDCAYLDPTEVSARGARRELARVQAAPQIKTLCVQSWELFDAEVRAQIVRLLEAQLPPR